MIGTMTNAETKYDTGEIINNKNKIDKYYCYWKKKRIK